MKKLFLIFLFLLLASSAFGAVAFDASTEAVRTDTSSPFEWTHTPVSTPRAVAVIAVHGTSATDHCSAISYGGVALTRKRTQFDSSGEPGRSSIWFLGAGIPTGAQTVSVTCGATTDDLHFTSITVTAAGDTEVIDSAGIDNNFTNPSVTLLYGGRTAISIAALYHGGVDATDFTPNVNCDTVQTHDFTGFFSEVIKQTTPGTVDFAIGGTAPVDDVAYSAIAISEIIGGFPKVADETHTTSDADALAYDVQMPPAVAANDLLLIALTASATPSAGVTVTATDWTTLAHDGSNNAYRLGVLAKNAAGNEDGTLVSVSINSATNSTSFVARVIRIPAGTWRNSGVLGNDVKVTIAASVSSANPDPPSLAPGWTENTLWYTVLGWATAATGTAAPAGYTNAWFSVAAQARLYTARREANAASEDPGTYTISAAAQHSAATIAVRPACPTITLDDTLPNGTIGVAYSTTSVSASGGTPAYTYAVTSGAIPAGLSFSGAGALSGTPTALGTANFTVTATDSIACTGARAYDVVISCPTITLDDDLPDGETGAAYTADVDASGGDDPYVYAVTSGALPDGVTLEADGDLTGTPSVDGTFNFTITATDDDTCTGNRAYTVVIDCPTITLDDTLADGTVGVAYIGTVTASDGTAPYTYAVTAGALPTGVSLAANGALSGTPTVANTFTFTITATDANACTGANSGYSVLISAAPPPAAGGENIDFDFRDAPHWNNEERPL